MEGTLFVVKRLALSPLIAHGDRKETPVFQFVILNRLGPTNLVETITTGMDAELRKPLLVRRCVVPSLIYPS